MTRIREEEDYKKLNGRRQTNASRYWIFCQLTQRHPKWHSWEGYKSIL